MVTFLPRFKSIPQTHFSDNGCNKNAVSKSHQNTISGHNYIYIWEIWRSQKIVRMHNSSFMEQHRQKSGKGPDCETQRNAVSRPPPKCRSDSIFESNCSHISINNKHRTYYISEKSCPMVFQAEQWKWNYSSLRLLAILKSALYASIGYRRITTITTTTG